MVRKGAMQHLGAMLGLVLLCVTVSSADSMRCETGRIVSSGDSIDEVLEKCGEPGKRKKEKRCHDVAPLRDYDTRKHRASRDSDCLAVEVWTYNFGPRRLTSKLTFTNGRLRTIESGDYGK